MRRTAVHKVDDNQAEIVRDLRKMYFSVRSTAMVGNGFPDIVVGFLGNNWMFEIKDPDKPPSGKKLTPKEKDFHEAWRGQVHIVETVDDILDVMFKVGKSPFLGGIKSRITVLS